MENTRKKAANDWLSQAIPIIQKEIKRLKIEDTSQLYRSIKGQVEELSGGDVYKATIAYEYYGIFPHYGVGGKVGKGDGAADKLSGGTRKRKPWLKTAAREASIFQNIIVSRFTSDAIENLNISKGTNGSNKINLKF